MLESACIKYLRSVLHCVLNLSPTTNLVQDCWLQWPQYSITSPQNTVTELTLMLNRSDIIFLKITQMCCGGHVQNLLSLYVETTKAFSHILLSCTQACMNEELLILLCISDDKESTLRCSMPISDCLTMQLAIKTLQYSSNTGNRILQDMFCRGGWCLFCCVCYVCAALEEQWYTTIVVFLAQMLLQNSIQLQIRCLPSMPHNNLPATLALGMLIQQRQRNWKHVFKKFKARNC